MKINTTKYRQVAEYLSANMNIIDEANSLNDIAKHINELIWLKDCEEILDVDTRSQLSVATISTIVYAVVGAHDHTDGMVNDDTIRLQMVRDALNGDY